MEGKAQWEVLGETLVNQYYKLFDENRELVLQFYHVSVYIQNIVKKIQIYVMSLMI